MRCWTIQHINWWKNAEGSVLRATWARAANGDRVTYGGFCRWLHEQGLWPKGAAPIWLWVVYSHKSRRPDLRHNGLTWRGEPSVLIEVSVPDELPVYTNLNVWCRFLSGYEVGGGVPFRRDDPLLSRLLIPPDMVYRKRHRADGWSHEGIQTVQAIIPYIKREWIQSVRQFVAR